MTGEKIKMTPVICIYHDDRNENLIIEVELPGVPKGGVKVDASKSGLCISGEREDIIYTGCYTLGHEISPDSAEAKYDNGFLRIKVPFKKADEKVKIEIK